MVREVLVSFGLVHLSSIACPLCGGVSESINHLFLHCDWSWRLWSSAMGWWGIVSCCNGELYDWMLGWSGLCVSKASHRAWSVLFCAICWTIWENRNGVVFGGKEAVISMALDSIIFRVACWFKSFGAGSADDLTILMLDVAERCIDSHNSKRKLQYSWSPPLDHDLLFNVDGSSFGNPGMAGIGGVLRDASGKVLCLFSSCVGIADSIMAEILAIHRACDLISSRMRLSNRNITILSDSKSVVSWINGEGFGKLSLVNLIYDIRQFLLSTDLVSIKFTPRSANSLADNLAKAGSVIQEDRLEWGL